MTIADHNAVLLVIRKIIAECCHIDVKHVWVTLEPGSLIIEAEIEPHHQITRWPETQELLLARNSQPEQATMADRSQHFTPVRAPESHFGYDGHDDSRITHNPQGFGPRLVTEKILNFTQLHGEQGVCVWTVAR